MFGSKNYPVYLPQRMIVVVVVVISVGQQSVLHLRNCTIFTFRKRKYLFNYVIDIVIVV